MQTAGAVGGVTDNRTTEIAGGSQSHTHDFTDSTGSESHLPPFYSLSFVMRIA